VLSVTVGRKSARGGDPLERNEVVESIEKKFGAIVKPLADGAPSGPGSDQSHHCKGVIFRKSSKPSGHATN
jgi:hypothetical protein